LVHILNDVSEIHLHVILENVAVVGFDRQRLVWAHWRPLVVLWQKGPRPQLVGRRAQHIFVIGKLLEKSNLTTARGYQRAIVLSHRLIDKRQQRRASAVDAVCSKVQIVYKENQRAAVD